MKETRGMKWINSFMTVVCIVSPTPKLWGRHFGSQKSFLWVVGIFFILGGKGGGGVHMGGLAKIGCEEEHSTFKIELCIFCFIFSI